MTSISVRVNAAFRAKFVKVFALTRLMTVESVARQLAERSERLGGYTLRSLEEQNLCAIALIGARVAALKAGVKL